MDEEAEMTVEQMVELVHHAATATEETALPIPPFVAEKKSEFSVYRAKSPSLNPVVVLEDCLSPAALLRKAPSSPSKRRQRSPSSSLSPSPSPPPPPSRHVPASPSSIRRRSMVSSPMKRRPTTASPKKQKPVPQKTALPKPAPPVVNRKKSTPPSPAKKKPEPPTSAKRKAEPPAKSVLPPKKRERGEKVPLALSCELTDWCAALTCSNNRTDQPDIAYFPFPRESERCKHWARNAEREDLVNKPSDYLNRNMVLCAKHFEDDQFFNATLRKRLMWDAVPTKFGPLSLPKKRPASKPKENTSGHSKISPFRRSTAILPAVKPIRKPDQFDSKMASTPILSNGMPAQLKSTVVVSSPKTSSKTGGEPGSPASPGNDTSHVYVSITPGPITTKTGSGTAPKPTQPKLVAVATPPITVATTPTRSASTRRVSTRTASTRKQIRRVPYSPPSSPTIPSSPVKQASASGSRQRRNLPIATSGVEFVQSVAMGSPALVPINMPFGDVPSSSSAPVKSPTAAVVPQKGSSSLPPPRGSVVMYPVQRSYPTKSSEIIALMRNHLQEPFASLFGIHLHLTMDSRVWTQSAHRLLLILYLHSPPQYRVLARMFGLPRRKRLIHWLQKVMPFYAGTQLRHLDLLHQAALNANSTMQLRFQRKSCIVTFRQIALTPQLQYDAQRDVLEGVEDFGRFGRSRYVASHMLVFMVKGLQTNWTLPIASYPVSSHLPPSIIRDLLLSTLNHVEMLGLHTKVIVCSDSEKHMAVFQDLDYTVSKPYVSFRGRRIMVMMDPAYLFRRLHHTLRQYDLQAGKETACYAHVEKFFELDSSRAHRLAPSLSQKDVHSEAPNLRAARHVFNASVATGLHTYVSFEQLPSEMSDTANVINLLSQLMDCFGGRKARAPAGRPLACIMTDNSGHVSFLSQLLIAIKNWNFVATSDDNSQPPPDPCLVALYKTLSSMLQLWFELKKFTRDHTLHTARFTTREPRLTKMMRHATKSATDATTTAMPAPTTSVLRQTLTEFSTRMVLASPHQLKKLKAHSLFVDLLVDRLKNEIQEKIPPKVMTAPQTRPVTSTTQPSTKTLPFGKQKLNQKKMEGSPTLSFPPVNTVSYIAGHMAQSLLKDHDSCEICDSQWVQQPPPKTAAVELFALWLGKASGSLEPATQFLVPSGSFVSFVTRCEELFLECFPYVLHMDRLSKRVICYIRRKIDQDKQFVSCPAIRRGLVQFFVKLRIEHAVCTYNAYLSKRKRVPKRRVHITPL